MCSDLTIKPRPSPPLCWQIHRCLAVPVPTSRLWVHCPRASDGLLPPRLHLVGYVRWDTRSNHSSLLDNHFQQLADRTVRSVCVGGSNTRPAVLETISPPSFLFGTDCFQSVPMSLVRVKSPKSGTSMHPKMHPGILLSSMTMQVRTILKYFPAVFPVWVHIAPKNMHLDLVLVRISPAAFDVRTQDFSISHTLPAHPQGSVSQNTASNSWKPSSSFASSATLASRPSLFMRGRLCFVVSHYVLFPKISLPTSAGTGNSSYRSSGIPTLACILVRTARFPSGLLLLPCVKRAGRSVSIVQPRFWIFSGFPRMAATTGAWHKAFNVSSQPPSFSARKISRQGIV